MNTPRIENSDRGFTVNKTGSLWAAGGFMLAILGAGWQVSSAFRDVQNQAFVLEEKLDDMQVERREYERAMEARVRVLEDNRSGAIVEIAALRRDLADLKAEQRIIAQEIRALVSNIQRFFPGHAQ